jgi:mRNA-degrading endonuclease RelE of RelBE toxin-antitoxin system
MTSPVDRTLQRTPRFSRDLKALPDGVQREAFETARKISQNLFHLEVDVKPLTGFKGIFRAVVSNENRLIFSYDQANVYLLRIAHRKDVYRSMEF